MSTSLKQALSLLLDRDVVGWIDEQLADGVSAETVSQRLFAATGVSVSPQSVRNWASQGSGHLA